MTGFVETLTLAWRFSLREMRAGLSGFMIFVACIALGVAAIGGVNSVARSITDGVAAQGRIILGGDMRFSLPQRPASDAERAFLEGFGTVGRATGIRSMARLPDGSDQSLVEIKAVDGQYPLYGELITEPPLPLEQLLGESDGVRGAAAPQALFDRLGLALGDRVAIGGTVVEMRAVITQEPDLLSDGFGFAPRLLVSLDALDAAALVQPGSLVRYAYRLRLPAGSSEADIADIRESAGADFADAGWSIRTRLRAAPALSSNIQRFSQFLTLVGLTALIVGGVGVANAVRAYLDAKRPVIATFKCLGASGRFVLTVYLVQIAMIASIAIVIGLAIAALAPFAAAWALSGVLPVAGGRIYLDALAMAVVFGALVTLAFALLPLGRARDIPATELFRELGFESHGLPRLPYLMATAALVSVLTAMAIWTAYDTFIAGVFIGAVAFAFVVLRLVSMLIQWLARRSPQLRSTPVRLAVGNIHRPGALTPSVVLSLGLGLTLLVTLALIDGNLRQQISGNLPDRAPNFFFVDIQSGFVDDFSALIAEQAPEGKLIKVPMLRGRVTALNEVPLSQLDISGPGSWVLRGDRGITYARNLPENSSLVDGEWWAPDYGGEPLVSFSAEEAGELGLTTGDTVTVNVLGRTVTARIANLRRVEWESLAINFVMVFSPNTFAGAPHAWLATLTDPQASADDESLLLNAVTRTFPSVTTVRVKDALDVVNRVVAQIGTAIRAAATVALVASVLVLSGALAAGNRARVHDSVVLKTLGATRRTLIGAFTLEYMMLGFATAVFALFAGGVSAWFVVTRIMTLPSSFMPEVALSAVLTALVLTVGFGLLGTWRVLGHKPAQVLREL